MDAMRICDYLWLAVAVVWAIGLLSTKQTQERAKAGARLVYGVIVVVAFLLMFRGRVHWEWLQRQLFARREWSDALGITLTALGAALAIWARLYLGRNWSSAVTVKVGHDLIRGGPYRWIRHPIYTGLLLAMLGTGVVRAELRAVLAFALLLLGFWVKLGMEEVFMRKTFGKKYEEYVRTTGALLPRFRK